ncbi:MAG: transcriptional regulator [Salaquimonas sp.]
MMSAESDTFPGKDDEPMVFIVIGEVRRKDEKEMIPFNALLVGPDDDTAVRQCLEALAQEGYEEADLHQIGNLEGRPEEDPFISAYDSALEGEVAIIAYEKGYDFSGGES